MASVSKLNVAVWRYDRTQALYDGRVSFGGREAAMIDKPLEAAGVTTRIKLPGVGKNLQDHISAAVNYRRRETGALYRRMRVDRIARDLASGYFLGRGPATDLPSGSWPF